MSEAVWAAPIIKAFPIIDVSGAADSEALFPRTDVATPDAHGRNQILALEDDDGMRLDLTITLLRLLSDLDVVLPVRGRR